MTVKETLFSVGHGVVNTIESFTDGTAKIANKVVDKHICIGVTGFNGSGKSTFITSLIHQLKYSNEAKLGGFLPARDEKIIETKLLPIPGLTLFDYEAGISALASEPPKWPEPTTSLSGCIVEITYKRDSFIKSVIGEQTTLRIEIRDYPGEWLLDIPLLNQDYHSWCNDMGGVFHQSKQQELMGGLFDDLNEISPFDVLNEDIINDIYSRFKDFLVTCKNEGLTLIQPGHVLLPGKADSFEAFFPLMNMHHYSVKALNKADKDCVYKVMLKRYKDYLKNIVSPFYKDYFKSVERQIIMVDTLKALSQGKDNFDDMMTSFSRIIDCYSYGKNGLFRRLISPKIERILFLSSKPDRVLSSQHDNLRHFTNDVIKRVCTQSIRNTIQIETEIACAVRCTEDKSDYLVGMTAEGLGKLTHPTVPDKIPKSDEWNAFEGWHPPELLPPLNTDLKHGSNLPCIRMDTVLKILIGDKF